MLINKNRYKVDDVNNYSSGSISSDKCRVSSTSAYKKSCGINTASKIRRGIYFFETN